MEPPSKESRNFPKGMAAGEKNGREEKRARVVEPRGSEERARTEVEKESEKEGRAEEGKGS
eukprot:2504975-Rhodomonas_salina.1